MRFWVFCADYGVFAEGACGVYADFFGGNGQCLTSASKNSENTGNGRIVLSTGYVPITLRHV